MRTLILFITLSISLNALALTLTTNDNTTIWTTSNLDDVETQVVDDASESELKELTECMSATPNEFEIGNTSCINEVFGDVHN